MDYLKKDIFYPSDGNYDSDLIDRQWEKYENYLIGVKEKLPKALWKAYESSDRFHDFWIGSIAVIGMAQYSHVKSDVVRLSLNRQETELYLEFSEIYYLKVLNENQDSCWVSVAMEDNANTGVTPEPAMLEEALLPNGSVRSENGIFLADIVEAEPDVWEIGAPDLFRKQRLDMKGWAKQKTHIAKLIRLHLILRYYNENEQIAFSLPYGTQRYAKPTLFLRFTDLRGRQTLKRIVKNYKIKKGLGTRFALRMMLSPGKGHWREVNLSHYPIGLSDCCRIRLL